MTSSADVISMLKEQEVKFVDLRFADTKGKEQHVTVPASEMPSTAPSLQPTQAPTVTFTVDMLPDFSQQAIKEFPEGAQARAWEWLLADNYHNDYPFARQLQRFALVTLYFSTNGDRWRDNDQWTNFYGLQYAPDLLKRNFSKYKVDQ